MTQEMVTYYARRAAEYDRVYDLPHWQRDVVALTTRLPAFFGGCRVFEVACGTGYWTRHVATTAVAVHGIDLNEETLAIARSRDYGTAHVTFEQRDAYRAGGAPRAFDAGLAGFWLSHVDLARLREFLDAFHFHLAPSARVLMFDERNTPARRTPATRADASGNRYEMRRLQNGEEYEIIKNYYDTARMDEVFAPYGTDITYEELERLWVLSYRVR